MKKNNHKDKSDMCTRVNQACGWLADLHCCSSLCVCHFQPLLMCTRRLGVTGLIVVFVSDYMFKKTWCRLKLLVSSLIKNTG